MRYIKVLFVYIVFLFSTNYIKGQCIVLSSGNGTDTQTVCINSPIKDITYTLALGVTDATATGLPAGVIGVFTPRLFTISGTPTVAGNYPYRVTTTGICTSPTFADGNITVNPLPVPSLVSSDADNIFCAGSSITFTAGGGTNYNFRVNGGSVQNGISTTYITAALTNGAVVDVIVTNSFGCSAISAGIANIVNPVPTATAANNGPVCPGTPLNLTGGPNGMLAYTWIGPNGYSSGQQSPQVSPSATAAMAGNYSLTVTNSFGCQNTATTTVVVRTPPAVTAANNGPVCVGSPLSLTGGPGGMTTYAWTGPNGFTSSQRSPQVSTSATLAMAGTYTLTVTDNNGCQNAASTVAVVNALPVATAASNSPVCIGTTLSLTGGPGGMSSYSWTGPNSFNSTLQSPVVSISATAAMAGTYTLTVINATGCSDAGTTIVTVNALPTATASNNSPVCVGTLLTLTGGPSGMAAYSWIGPNGFTANTQSPTVSSSATAAMAGIYTLTVTNSNGCQRTAATTITINALPVPTALNNGPVCVGSPLVLAGGPLGMTTYSWVGPNGFTSTVQSPTVSLTATEAMAGTYTLTVTNSNGCLNSISTVVVVNALPIASAANNGPVCSGKPLILTGGPAGMTTYAWTGPNGFTSTLQSPTVSLVSTIAMAGTYTLTVTNSIGCKGIANTTVVINQSPVATATSNSPVCVGSPLSLTGGPAGMTTYAWIGPNSYTSNLMSPVVSPSAVLPMAGIYTLTVTSITGCQDTATTRVRVYAVPVSNAGTGGTECDLNFILNAVPSVGIGLWTMVTGPGTASFLPNANAPAATVTVSAYGTYTFRWTETNGPCISISVVTVNFYQRPIANPGHGGDACNLTYSLLAVPTVGIGTWTMTSGSGIAIFTPNANTPTAVVQVSEYGTKHFTWTEVNGVCSDDSTITVNFYQQPVAAADPGGNNCGFEYNLRAIPSIGLGTWTRDSGPGTATFSPDAHTANAAVTINAYGLHIFRWTEVNGSCSSSVTVSVTFIEQPAANGGNDADECDLNRTLNAVPGAGTGTWTKVSGPGNVTFTPDPNHYNAVATVTQFGIYYLAWTVTNSFCSSSDIIRVTFHDVPAVSAGADAIICRGRSIQLNATGPGPTFLWSPANLLNNPNISNPVATPTISTAFTVRLTDQWGCVNSDQVNVEVRVQPVANAGPDKVLQFLFETDMEAGALGPNQTGVWTILEGDSKLSDINSPSSHVSDLSIDVNSFIWTVTNGICPLSSDTVNLVVHDLKIPSLITPNLDGNNDLFIIQGVETFGKTELTVFNRWGARVYENNNYDNSWNGVDDNENPLPEDTYFFVLKPENRKTIKGYVVIRR